MMFQLIRRLIDLGISLIPASERFLWITYDLSLNDSKLNNETTKLRTIATASPAKNSVSVVGNKVYVGNGTTADHVATIVAL